MSSTNSQAHRSNDGTSRTGNKPADAGSLAATGGLYSPAPGDTGLANMTALPASVSGNNADVRSRAWFVGPSPQASRTSASYALAAEAVDAGGAASLSSASYAVKDASLGTVSALAAAFSYTAKGGYAGQLYEVQGLTVTSPSPSLNENTSIQLGAAPVLDDNTLLDALAAGAVSFAVVNGPIASVSAGGLAMAAAVYQDTPATVRATSGGLTGTGALTVRNVNLDDYGPYAGDGIDDAWQVRYFGLNNPLAGPDADADGTGQTNFFKYLTGLNPLEPGSRFVLAISTVSGQSTQKTLTFSPVYSGRTYTVQSTGSLTQPAWTTLANATVSVNGNTETVTDPNAAAASRFYRVQVSLP